MKKLESFFLIVALIAITCINVQLWQTEKATEKYINTVLSIEAERDTTYSLRNYEVLTDSLNNVLKKWHDETGNQ